jgi:hypothetical protein
MHQGKLRECGRVADLVKQYDTDLERIFLKLVGYEPEAEVVA